MCEVTPYMVSIATKCGSITYIPQFSVVSHSAVFLISTTGVAYIFSGVFY